MRIWFVNARDLRVRNIKKKSFDELSFEVYGC